MSMKLCINSCSRHGYYSVSIDGNDSGQRITPSKCCGSWHELKSWQLSASDWREIENLAREAAQEIEDAA